MASKLEFSARAALCRELARREPANGVLWMAEAENWSRLSNENFAASQTKLGYRTLAGLRARSAKSSSQ